MDIAPLEFNFWKYHYDLQKILKTVKDKNQTEVTKQDWHFFRM